MFPLYENLTYNRSDLPLILYKFVTSNESDQRIHMINYTSTENRESVTTPCYNYTHWHSSYEILLILSDETELYLNGDLLRPKCGDIILIDAFDIHTVGTKHNHYVVLIDPARLHTSTDCFPLHTQNKYLEKDGPYEKIRQDIEQHIVRMSEKLLDGPQPSTLGVLGDIYNMLAKIADYKRMIEPQSNKKTPHHSASTRGMQKNKNASTQKETLKKIFNFIEQNYRDNIALSDIASVAGFNQSYFCRFFKGATGRTLVEYLNEYRCHIARRRLENASESITEIALECGFSSVSYFSRTFKSYFGVSPSAYRKQLYPLTYGS
ncbi:AraC family transcriptional regulator [Fusibacter sp. JL216-2]|uniref:AraC family transcriptional regulator n=1 Tax=Fusibacter sp. JL216-2 TaxID=3071453 RepID=UPI003D35011B